MRLAPLFRYRRRLLMQFDPTRRLSSPSSSGHPSLKRPFAQQATADAAPEAQSYQDRSNSSQRAKYPKFEGTQSPSRPPPFKRSATTSLISPAFEMPSSNTQSPRTPKSSSLKTPRLTGSSGSGSGSGSLSRSLFKDAKGKTKVSTTKPFELPIRDHAYIVREHRSKASHLPPIKKVHEENPKSPLANFFIAHGKVPEYESITYTLPGGSRAKIWRTTVTVDLDTPIVGVGDDFNKKLSEKLAALSAVYQLYELGMLESTQKAKDQTPSPAAEIVTEVKLSDNSIVGYERARQFMDYYCRLYNFGKPDIALMEAHGKRGQNSTWEATMTVGGRRIGLGVGPSKKSAQMASYLDVTQYLEGCDPQLWQKFVQVAKEGKDLGMAPKVFFQMSDGLDDEIRDLCHDMKKSLLYKNRPAGKTSSDGPELKIPSASARSIGRSVPASFLPDKSERLLKRHQAYLEDPHLERMRQTRASLPVYSRSDDLLSHIRDHDVTICMAATGSGKTTQVPQLILEDYVARGQGAHCNVVCTQPRRIAAVSVADRVAKERGEVVGRGAVGYQVRFDAKLPEDHGSITFCTTGIFLKRLQSALADDAGRGGPRSLDDVTHVVVDEVHERDVDTDLLLVVLKRLMADRKARNKPIKIVLMSATIDPTLFQKYFPDNQGQPASVTEIPGRSFPVTKHFLEDFVPQLISSRDASWVFSQEPVVRYLNNELGVAAVSRLNIGRGPSQGTETDRQRDDDLELPYPLIALTVSHLLQRTDSGHVLVFLPGWEEIMAAQRCLQSPAGSLGLDLSDAKKYSIHVLHSSVPLAEQQLIFEPPPAGVRRIILATNIAETSVTIPDVVYVVDTARIKEQRYDPERHMSSLVSAWVGSSNLNQRAGRAGRHRPGEYFGILGRKHAEELHPYQTVEMKRVDLTNVVMHVKALDFPGMSVEEVLAATIEPPAAERVGAAMKNLHMVGALDQFNNLTSLGRVLLQLPVDAQMGRLVLFGSFFRCLDQALTLAAILTNRDPFVSPMHLKQDAAQKKNSWTPQEFRSDALATLQAYNAWQAMQSRGDYNSANRFCVENFLSKPTLLMIQKIKGHLLQALYHAGVIDVSAGGRVAADGSFLGASKGIVVPPELNANGDSLPLLAGLIAIASQPKFAIRTGEKTYRTSQDKMTLIHPSSVNHRKREVQEQDSVSAGEKQLYAYAEKRQNVSVAGAGAGAHMFLVTTTRLDPMTYMLFGAYDLVVTERGLDCDGWLPIVGNLDALDDIQRLKTLMDSCMLRVFQGITMGRRHRQRNMPPPVRPRGEEAESGDDDDERKDYSMSRTELKELDRFTRDVVRILNRYSDERIAIQSRQNSRPATPMGSPSSSSVRLPGGPGPWSGHSTPYTVGSAYNSRPGTPSRLSRVF